jgi:MoaA/NifB/PqqE/SkfB family radical SAM enzyme
MAERRRFTCDWIFDCLVINCDGKVICGCADPNGERPVGHIEEAPLKEIWNNETARAIRRGLNEGYSPFCLDCGLKCYVDEDSPLPRRPEVLDRLPRIYIEPTVVCNLDCHRAVCNKTSGIVATRSRKRFPLEQFKRVLADVGPELYRLDLFNYGEPFAHPQCVEMIEHVKRELPHIVVYVSTNGLLLNEEKIRRITEAGLDELTFSVDGTDQRSYEVYRCGGDFERVVGLMRTAVAEKKRVGREVPFINWRYILFGHNDSRRQMNRARKMAAEIGVDRLSWEITDHPDDLASPRYQPGTRWWKAIEREIWNVTQTGNAIRSKRNLARIRVRGREIRATAGVYTVVGVTIENTGGMEWLMTTWGPRRFVRLGVQLFDEHRNPINRDYARTPAPNNLAPGESSTFEFGIPAVDAPGIYWLKFDMVSEGVGWFETGGSKVTWVKMINNPR